MQKQKLSEEWKISRKFQIWLVKYKHFTKVYDTLVYNNKQRRAKKGFSRCQYIYVPRLGRFLHFHHGYRSVSSNFETATRKVKLVPFVLTPDNWLQIYCNAKQGQWSMEMRHGLFSSSQSPVNM